MISGITCRDFVIQGWLLWRISLQQSKVFPIHRQFPSVSGMSRCALGTEGREAVQCHSCRVKRFSAETEI